MSKPLRAVTLIKDGIGCYFQSITEAGERMNIPRTQIGTALLRNGKCHGWKVKDGFVKPEPKVVVVEPEKPILKINGLLTPNKTEREYYRYLAEKGAKA